jgi:hypothetical protein
MLTFLQILFVLTLISSANILFMMIILRFYSTSVLSVKSECDENFTDRTDVLQNCRIIIINKMLADEINVRTNKICKNVNIVKKYVGKK